MRYLCLIYNSADTGGTLSAPEVDALIGDHFAYDDGLRREGRLLRSDALEMPDRAVTIRVRQGRMQSTDGPFVETKEHLAGFYLVEAADMAEAAEIAARIPSARYGAVEVRPIRTLTLPDKR